MTCCSHSHISRHYWWGSSYSRPHCFEGGSSYSPFWWSLYLGLWCLCISRLLSNLYLRMWGLVWRKIFGDHSNSTGKIGTMKIHWQLARSHIIKGSSFGSFEFHWLSCLNLFGLCSHSHSTTIWLTCQSYYRTCSRRNRCKVQLVVEQRLRVRDIEERHYSYMISRTI